MRLKNAIDKIKQEKLEVAPKPSESLGEQHNSQTYNTFNYTQTKVTLTDPQVLSNNRIVTHNKNDPRSVPFQMLRSKVLRELRINGWNSIAVSAPTPGAGKSQVAVNLAISIAQEVNQTVLIVDMDLRRPSIHKYFDLDPEYGVQDCVELGIPVTKALVNPGIERLVLLPGRNRTLNSSETLSLPSVKALTDELRSKYESRIIIYDLPPLLVSDDVMVFLPNVDCSLLIVESGKNTPKEVEASINMLNSKPLLGTILNKERRQEKIYLY